MRDDLWRAADPGFVEHDVQLAAVRERAQPFRLAGYDAFPAKIPVYELQADPVG